MAVGAEAAGVIARVWKATARLSRVPDYVEHFTSGVMRALEAAPGFRGAQVLSNGDRDPAELMVVTWWASREAVQAFAGADIGRAVVDAEARAMLLSCDEAVTHYSVVASHGSGREGA